MTKYGIALTIVVLSLAFGSLTARARDWRTGQIVGIANRSGGTPFFTQLATLSPIDHVAVIVLDAGTPYVYESNGTKGYNRELAAHYFARIHANAAYLIAEPTDLSSLSPAQLTDLALFFRTVVTSGTTQQRSCSEFVREGFARVGIHLGQEMPFANLNWKAFNGFIQSYWRTDISADKRYVPPVTLFDKGVNIVENHLGRPLHWNEHEFLNEWSSSGDWSAVARLVALRNRRMLRSPRDIQTLRDDLVKMLKAQLGNSAKNCEFELEAVP